MSIQFNDTVNNTGICQQARVLAGVDATQWPTVRVANSCNSWDDFVTATLIGADKRFQWDNTNHTKLPEGTMELTINTTDYSFLTDEQGNAIVTLIGVSLLVNGKYEPLMPIDRNDSSYDIATFGTTTGVPTCYDKIADNIIRLDKKPSATVAAGLKLFFQRVGPAFTAASTTTTPGVSPLLHRGYVIAAAYDIALTLGLKNLQALSIERQREEQKVQKYPFLRSRDERTIITMARINYI